MFANEPERRHFTEYLTGLFIAERKSVSDINSEYESSPQEPTLIERPEGARIVLTASAQERGEAVRLTCQELSAQGQVPVVVPFSGSTPLTALAYAQAFTEINEDLDSEERRCDAIVLSSATGGIQAGLEVGKRLLGAATAIVGVTPGCPVEEVRARTVNLAIAASRLAGMEIEIRPRDVCVLGNYSGDAYMMPSEESEAAELAATLEGLSLDPTYTAKAFAALLGEIRRARFSTDDTVVYLHTAG